MTDHKKFKNESQDARRHDKQNATHPDEKYGNHHDKTVQEQEKSSQSKSDKRK